MSTNRRETLRSQRNPVVVEPETTADHAAVREVVRRAFDTQSEVPDLVDAIRSSPEYVPELSLVARQGGTVVGHVMLSHAYLVADDGARRRILTLSPLAVHPEHQRQGVGSALVRAGLAAADARGEPLVTLEGSPDYYPRFGFEVAAAHGVAIRLPDWAPPEAGMVARLTAYDPVLRGRLEYPPAFDLVTDQ